MYCAGRSGFTLRPWQSSVNKPNFCAPGRLWHPSRHLLGPELRRRGAPTSIALLCAFCKAELPGATADGNIVVGADRHSASVSGSKLAVLKCC